MTLPPIPPRRRLLGGVALLLFATLAAPGAAAQLSSTGTTQVVGVTVYRYAEAGQSVIAVDLMGSVRQGGRYLVPPDTKLLDLLALAGGITATTEAAEIEQTITVELSRAGEGGRSRVFQATFEDLTSGVAVPPPLVGGDVVTVTTRTKQRFDWVDAITIAGSVAGIALVILRIATDV